MNYKQQEGCEDRRLQVPDHSTNNKKVVRKDGSRYQMNYKQQEGCQDRRLQVPDDSTNNKKVARKDGSRYQMIL